MSIVTASDNKDANKYNRIEHNTIQYNTKFCVLNDIEFKDSALFYARVRVLPIVGNNKNDLICKQIKINYFIIRLKETARCIIHCKLDSNQITSQ